MTTATTVETPATAVAHTVIRSKRRVFRAAIVAEWTKLRSVRSTVWSLLATFGITVGFGALLSTAYISRYDRLSPQERLTFDPTAHSLRGLFLAQLAIGVLGVLVISSEYATGMIRTTFTAMPQRRIVLAGKTVVFGAVAAAVSVVSTFTVFFAGQAILNSKNVGVSLGDPHVLRAVLGATAYLTIVGVLGLGLATIVRRTAGAIASLFGLVLVLPLLARALPSPWNDDVSKFLPGQAGQALFTVRPSNGLLTPGSALVVLVLWLVMTFGAAIVLISRRDA